MPAELMANPGKPHYPKDKIHLRQVGCEMHQLKTSRVNFVPVSTNPRLMAPFFCGMLAMLAKINETLKMLIDKSNKVSAVLGQFFGLSLDFLGNFFHLKLLRTWFFFWAVGKKVREGRWKKIKTEIEFFFLDQSQCFFKERSGISRQKNRAIYSSAVKNFDLTFKMVSYSIAISFLQKIGCNHRFTQFDQP